MLGLLDIPGTILLRFRGSPILGVSSSIVPIWKIIGLNSGCWVWRVQWAKICSAWHVVRYALKDICLPFPPTSAHFPTEIWLHSDYFFHLVRSLSPSKGHDYELSDVLEPWSTSPCPAQYWAQSENRVSCLGLHFWWRVCGPSNSFSDVPFCP